MRGLAALGSELALGSSLFFPTLSLEVRVDEFMIADRWYRYDAFASRRQY